MHSRRDLLASVAAFGAAAALPRLANAATPAPTGEAAKMYALFDRAMAETFRRSPEVPTYLGIDKGALSESAAFVETWTLVMGALFVLIVLFLMA